MNMNVVETLIRDGFEFEAADKLGYSVETDQGPRGGYVIVLTTQGRRVEIDRTNSVEGARALIRHNWREWIST